MEANLNDPTLKNKAMQYNDGANSLSIMFNAVFIPSNIFYESIFIKYNFEKSYSYIWLPFSLSES